MKRTFLAIFIAISPFLWPINQLHAEESAGTNDEEHIKKVEISAEDRQVIQMMELLTMMDFLKDMELLEGRMKDNTEDRK